MNSVVMIAYYFPPDGSAGVYRPLRFVRQLPGRGWHPSVVTVNGNGHARYDPQLMELVPEEIEVVRVPHRDIWQAIQAKRTARMRARIDNASPRESARVTEGTPSTSPQFSPKSGADSRSGGLLPGSGSVLDSAGH